MGNSFNLNLLFMFSLAISLHKQKAPESLKLFHERMESCFADMQASVEAKYGKKVTDYMFTCVN